MRPVVSLEFVSPLEAPPTQWPVADVRQFPNHFTGRGFSFAASGCEFQTPNRKNYLGSSNKKVLSKKVIIDSDCTSKIIFCKNFWGKKGY